MVQEVAARTVEVLKDINTILRGCGQQFGYRTAREIIRWVDLAVASGMDPNSALDVQIEQKVLVKVQGSRSNKAERSMLDTLFSYLGDREGSASGNLALPRCYNRVQHMLETLKEDDFAFGQY
jgi:adenylosuccinate synthase